MVKQVNSLSWRVWPVRVLNMGDSLSKCDTYCRYINENSIIEYEKYKK